MKHHNTPTRVAKITKAKYREGCGPTCIVTWSGGGWNGITTLEKDLVVSYQTKHTATLWPHNFLLGIDLRKVKQNKTKKDFTTLNWKQHKFPSTGYR